MKDSRIKDSKSKIINQYKASGQTNPESDKQANVKNVKAEKVILSGRDIQQVRKVINNLPDVRTKKVKDLKKKICQGTYHVNGEEIAVKMLGESLLDIIV